MADYERDWVVVFYGKQYKYFSVMSPMTREDAEGFIESRPDLDGLTIVRLSDLSHYVQNFEEE